MKFYDDRLVLKVRRKRETGASLRDLEKMFSVPGTTISRWVRDIKIDDPNYRRHEAMVEETRNKYKNLVGKININKDLARLLVAVLYWCEGSKYPSSNVLAFSNSDQTLVSSFLGLLRRGFEIDENKLRAHLQLHTTHHQKRVLKYWSRLLDIDVNRFYKPTITNPTKTMKRRNYLGTCTIKYFDVKSLLYLSGIFESLSQKLERYPRGRKGGVC